ncbi:MAG: hypothetical protein ACOCPQ_00035 [Desulfosudaceae bacterium]
MVKWMRRTTVLMLMAALLMAPMAATAAENGTATEGGPGAMAADVVLVRPVGIAATAVGTALFFASLPFSALGGNTGAASKALVADPFQFTFMRPIGRF